MVFNQLDDTVRNIKNSQSGFSLFNVARVQFSIIPFTASIGSSYIKLSGILTNMTKTIQNIKNEDNKCFYYCIFAYFYNLEKSQAKDEDNEDNKTPRRYGDMKHISAYINKNKDKVKFDNIEFPFEFNDDIFRMFEDMNPLIALKVLYFHHEDENDTVGNELWSLEYYFHYNRRKTIVYHFLEVSREIFTFLTHIRQNNKSFFRLDLIWINIHLCVVI